MTYNKELIYLFQRDLKKTIKEIESFRNDENLWLTVDGVLNSSGHLALHIAGNIQHYVGSILGNTGYIRNRTAEFSSINKSKKDIIEELEKAISAIPVGLSKVSPDQLSSPFENPPFPVSNTNEFILHLYGHLNYHLGQINYQRRFLE